MNIKEILKQHALWSSTEGKQGKHANLHKANLTGADLTGADLPRANLSGAYLTGADLSGAYLSRADLTEADLSRANLSRADLTGANLHGANLRGADLTCTSIYGFSYGRDFGYYHGGIVTIGCETHSLEHWLKCYKLIGERADYTALEVSLYGAQLKFIKEYIAKED